MAKPFSQPRFMTLWRRFREETEGSSTIEAVLWLPLFVVFFVMIADVSFVFHRQSQIMNIIQDANRSFSVGLLPSDVTVVDFVNTRLSGLTSSATVTSQISGGIVTTQVLVPVDDLVAVGMFNFLMDYNIGVSSQQYVEY